MLCIQGAREGAEEYSKAALCELPRVLWSTASVYLLRESKYCFNPVDGLSSRQSRISAERSLDSLRHPLTPPTKSMHPNEALSAATV